MAKIDHHVHTTRYSPDSVIELPVLVARALAAGLDAVIITEHDAQWTAKELAALQRQAGALLVLSGAEISTREGHFLVYGLPDLAGAGPGIGLGALLKLVKRHDAAIVAAHPFRWDQDFRALLAEHGPAFDGLELVSNNVTPETRARTAAALAEHPSIGATGSSDGHEPAMVGCYYTEVDGPVRSIGDFVSALKSRKFGPGHTPGMPMAAGALR